ncbi:unnamed protein product [Linum tenue]|uniref:TF-B3 domain-containing protein n=1 Tax=Linum tenue TaxID=586396 RepID=A0AAV0RCT4_9ROSI|nr:unnamed protein product [Linum tenue]
MCQYIPTEFVKNYRSRLGSSATLKVANGDTWEVELVTDDDGLIWLVKGWEDFTNHHSLKQGDILVFRLDQNSLFQVMIFEPSASEKNYRCKDVNDLGKLLNDIKVEEECDAGKEKGSGTFEKIGNLTGHCIFFSSVEQKVLNMKD